MPVCHIIKDFAAANSIVSCAACRSNAVRVLCQIVDGQLLAQIERYLKQAVVDKSPVVAASVLVSALHLMHSVSGAVTGWGRG